MSKIDIIKNLTNRNYSTRTDRKIEYLVIHYYGAFGSAEANTRYFKDVYRGSSAHYFIDEKGIWQSVEDKNDAWHCGGSGVGLLKGICKNANSLGIELRPNKIDRGSTSSSDLDWYFEPEVLDIAIPFIQQKMEEYGLGIERVVRHGDVTGKLCPRPFIGDDGNTYYNESGNQLWAEFIQRIEGEGAMTQEQFNKLMDTYLDGLRSQEPSQWSEEPRKWAESNGIIVDTQYKDYVTREQMVAFLHRLSQLQRY